MSLAKKLMDLIPELTYEDFGLNGKIELQDNSDGKGPFIVRWDLDIPIPDEIPSAIDG